MPDILEENSIPAAASPDLLPLLRGFYDDGRRGPGNGDGGGGGWGGRGGGGGGGDWRPGGGPGGREIGAEGAR